MRQVVFKFPDRDSAEMFIEFMNEIGEQNYFDYVDASDERKKLKVRFNYNYVNLVVECEFIKGEMK